MECCVLTHELILAIVREVPVGAIAPAVLEHGPRCGVAGGRKGCRGEWGQCRRSHEARRSRRKRRKRRGTKGVSGSTGKNNRTGRGGRGGRGSDRRSSWAYQAAICPIAHLLPGPQSGLALRNREMSTAMLFKDMGADLPPRAVSVYPNLEQPF